MPDDVLFVQTYQTLDEALPETEIKAFLGCIFINKNTPGSAVTGN